MINEVMNAEMSVTNPKVGMCATMFVGSDRYAMVVTEVLAKNKIRVEHMLDNHYDEGFITDETGAEFVPVYKMHNYAHVNDTETSIVPSGTVYTYRKNKRWMPVGTGLWETCSIHLGSADNYLDPCF